MTDRNDPVLPPMLTAEQTADLLGIEVQTLAAWRHRRTYDLRYVRVGRAIRYRRADVLAWIDRQTVGIDAE